MRFALVGLPITCRIMPCVMPTIVSSSMLLVRSEECILCPNVFVVPFDRAPKDAFVQTSLSSMLFG